MTEPWRRLAEALSADLELDQPPVQVSYLEHAPDGVPEHPGGVPSVCTFFAEGTERPFYAGLPAHEDCEIGAFVLGVPPTGALGERLAATVGAMQREGYLRPGEEARIPRNPTPPRFVAYGPLGSLPMAPTGVLLFARPKSVMLAIETAGVDAPMLGRPMCAILPTLRAGTPVAVSVGCSGSRTYMELGDDRLIVGIRGDFLPRFVEQLARVRRANRWVEAEDAARKSAAARPFRPAAGPAVSGSRRGSARSPGPARARPAARRSATRGRRAGSRSRR